MRIAKLLTKKRCPICNGILHKEGEWWVCNLCVSRFPDKWKSNERV